MKTFLLAMLASLNMLAQVRALGFGSCNEGSGNIMSVARDEYATFGNPSGLSFGDSSGAVSFSTGQQLSTANFRTYTTAAVFPLHKVKLGFGINRYGEGPYSEHKAKLAISHQINTISLGAALSYDQFRAEGYTSRWGLTLNLGGSIRLHPNLDIGTYITNVSRTKIGDSAQDYLPTLIAVGLRYRVASGVTILSELEKYTHAKESIKLGMSYQLMRCIALSSGVNSFAKRFFFGLNISSSHFNVGCSYSYHYYLSSRVQITLKLRFR